MNKRKLIILLGLVALICVLTIILIIVLRPPSNNVVEQSDSPVSYPESENINPGSGNFNLYSNEELGVSIKYPQGVDPTIINEDDIHDFYKLSNVVDFKNPSGSDLFSYLTITPINASNASDSLNLLEKFIVTKVGAIRKSNQITKTIGDKEISQIGYILDSSEGIFDVFLAVKQEDRGFIFKLSIENEQEYLNSFNYDNSGNKYKEVIDSLEFKDEYDISEFNRLSELTSNMINLYKESNGDLFNSTLY